MAEVSFPVLVSPANGKRKESSASREIENYAHSTQLSQLSQTLKPSKIKYMTIKLGSSDST